MNNPPREPIPKDVENKGKKQSVIKKREYPKVYSFLKGIQLESFLDTFIINGIDNEEKIHLLNYDMLKLLNIPYKYRKTILNQIQNQTTTPNQTQNSFFTNNDKYEELLCPAEEDDRVIDDE